MAHKSPISSTTQTFSLFLLLELQIEQGEEISTFPQFSQNVSEDLRSFNEVITCGITFSLFFKR